MMGHDGTAPGPPGAPEPVSRALRFVLREPDAHPWPVDEDARGRDATGITVARLADRIHADDRSWVLATRLAALHDGRPARMTYRVETPGGSTRWVLELLDVHGDEGGRDVDGVAIDVTPEHTAFAIVDTSLARVTAELDTLARRERASATFVRLLLHDVRGLLHDCRETVDAVESAEAIPAADRLHASLDRLEELAVGILETERLDDDAELRRSPVDLAVVAARVTERVARAAITEDLRTAPSTGDPFLLERVVDNLLRNALEHTPAGTCVRVSTWSDRAGAVVEVADDGPGIPPSLHEHVFDPFVRLDGAGGPGVGMGLSLVDRVVALHGGRCSVRETPGGGTTIRVELPVPPDDAERERARIHQATRSLEALRAVDGTAVRRTAVRP